ncbi:hypothetical protein Csa_005402 [Cucumis sativus]|nr:hypothetical protein Csa_005402 [Cucumis sativus]
MRKFMEEELHALRKDVDEVRAECLSRHNANETLTDYRPKEKRTNESGGEVSETRKEHVHKARDSHRDSGRHGKATEAKKGTSFKTPSPCFLCNGPHWARDCPQKKVLSALMAKLHKREEEEVPIPEEAHLGGIQYLGAMKVVPSSKEPIGKGLLYVDATLNNQAALALLDTGATSNIIDLEEAKRLGLKITRRDDVELKIINAEPTRNYGWAWNVKVKIGEWKGKIDFLLAPLDDCKVVLGLDFMKQAHAYVDATRETLVFPNKKREVPLKCIGMTGKVMIGAMQTRRHRKGKGSNGSVATRALRRVQRDIDPQESSGLGEMLISLRGKLVTLHVADIPEISTLFRGDLHENLGTNNMSRLPIPP